MADGHGLAMTLRRAYLTLHRRADDALQPLDLTADQFALLAELSRTDGLIQRQLVERLASDANTVTAIIRRLELKGWIQRTDAPGDARARQVWLTTSGRAVRNRGARRLATVWRHLLSVADELAAPLNRLVDALAPANQTIDTTHPREP